MVENGKLLYTVKNVKDITAFNLVSGQAYKDAVCSGD